MIDVKITINGDKIVIAGLDNLSRELPGAINRGLERCAVGIYGSAFDWLSGGARSQVRLRDTDKHKKSRLRGQSDLMGARPGSWPVPRITGHLRESLAWLGPGTSKSGDVGTVTAGENEAIIFNSASYAMAIFEGRGSSSAYGPRDALQAAFEEFNQGDNIRRVIEEEIAEEINRQGV